MDDMVRNTMLEMAKSILDTSSSSSEEASSSEDDEGARSVEDDLQLIYLVMLTGNVRGECVPLPRVKGYVENVIPNYSDATFKSHFRMLPSTFEEVLRLVGPALTHTPSATGCGRKPVPAEKQLLLALWYMGTPDSFRSVCEKFDVGRATALRSLRRVTYALHCLAPQVIRWPTGGECRRVKEGFFLKSNFPNIIGAIDGTHIKIDAPRVDAQSYVTRKDVHAVHLQAVCNDIGCFTHCLAGNAASVHDARILRNSAIANYMSAGEAYFPEDGHLVGDGAYGIHPHLMVPFRDNGNMRPAQRLFNERLSQARQTIERAFGLLKGRFRSLRDNLPLVDLSKVPEYIIACCVLHNICTLQGDALDDCHPINPVENVVEVDLGNLEVKNMGKLKRNRIMDDMVGN